jgi:acetylornithine deacetylase/succinyl-diaminopimelate desuccinylase-like protein
VPSVIFGPGSIEQAHSSNEYIELDEVFKAAHILGEFVERSDNAVRQARAGATAG